MSLDRIIRPFTQPDIFPAKSRSALSLTSPATSLISLQIGKRDVKPKTLKLTNSGQATVYAIKRPTEQ